MENLNLPALGRSPNAGAAARIPPASRQAVLRRKSISRGHTPEGDQRKAAAGTRRRRAAELALGNRRHGELVSDPPACPPPDEGDDRVAPPQDRQRDRTRPRLRASRWSRCCHGTDRVRHGLPAHPRQTPCRCPEPCPSCDRRSGRARECTSDARARRDACLSSSGQVSIFGRRVACSHGAAVVSDADDGCSRPPLDNARFAECQSSVSRPTRLASVLDPWSCWAAERGELALPGRRGRCDSHASSATRPTSRRGQLAGRGADRPHGRLLAGGCRAALALGHSR